MFGKLLPQTVDFFNYFEKHILIVAKGAQDFDAMIEHSSDLVYDAEKIRLLEKEADKAAFSCIESLHNSFITPFDRNDIYRLITGMDDIIDLIEDTAARMVIYKLDPKRHNLKPMVKYLLHSTQLLVDLINILRQNKVTTETKQHFQEIHLIENKADNFVREAIAHLFENENDPIEIIKWKEIFENLENAIDSCEKVANIIDGIMIENQ